MFSSMGKLNNILLKRLKKKFHKCIETNKNKNISPPKKMLRGCKIEKRERGEKNNNNNKKKQYNFKPQVTGKRTN